MPSAPYRQTLDDLLRHFADGWDPARPPDVRAAAAEAPARAAELLPRLVVLQG